MGKLAIVFNPKSAVTTGPNRVEVHATVTAADHAEREWVVTLARQGQRYVVLTTREVNQ